MESDARVGDDVVRIWEAQIRPVCGEPVWTPTVTIELPDMWYVGPLPVTIERRPDGTHMIRHAYEP